MRSTAVASLATAPALARVPRARAAERVSRVSARRTRGVAVLASSERRVTAHAASASAQDPGACSAWRGDTPPQSSLPVNADGSVDYSSIDASPISKVLIRTIRGLLVEEVGKDTDPRPWDVFDAVLTPVREVNDMDGTARDVTVRAKRVFAGILPALYIGWVPPIWKNAISKVAPQWASNYAFVLVFTTLFPWLMGPMEGIDHVDVPVPESLRKAFKFLPETVKVPQAIKAERCRFLEQSGCASVCVNSCKAPSQEWLGEDFGMDLHIQPNYDDFSCQWKFDVKPPPLYEDAAVMVPCFTNCPSEYKGEKDAWRQAARVKSGFGVENGVDLYTGETLEAIARRASEAAKADAALVPSAGGYATDGTAVSEKGFIDRVETVKSGGKCWSVDEARAVMGEVRTKA
mgnify:FL=1|jgi:hypothetical protein